MSLGSKKPDNPKEKGNESVVSMKNINEFIVTVMKNVFQPQQGERFDFCDILDLCCMPQFKFVQGSTNPFI